MSYICEKCGEILHECLGKNVKVICALCYRKIMAKVEAALEKMKGDNKDGKQFNDKGRKSK